MSKLKIFCKNAKDAKNKLNILEQYGIKKGGYIGDIGDSAYYILNNEDKKIEDCWPASTDGIKDIPEVCYDFFNISDVVRAQAYSNCDRVTSNPIICLLRNGVNCWFVWENTPEGRDYWSELFITLSGTDTSQTPTFKEEEEEKSPPKFKVGDKVVIHLCVNKDYQFSYSSEMLTYNGKTATIIKVETNAYSPNNSDEDGCEYKLNIDDDKDIERWAWSSPMLVPATIKVVNALDKEIFDYSTLKLKDYESRLQKQEDHLSGRDRSKPVRFHGGKHQVRIASKHLSYQKAIGRG